MNMIVIFGFVPVAGLNPSIDIQRFQGEAASTGCRGFRVHGRWENRTSDAPMHFAVVAPGTEIRRAQINA
jgi:hypothetical protein